MSPWVYAAAAWSGKSASRALMMEATTLAPCPGSSATFLTTTATVPTKHSPTNRAANAMPPHLAPSAGETAASTVLVGRGVVVAVDVSVDIAVAVARVVRVAVPVVLGVDDAVLEIVL